MSNPIDKVCCDLAGMLPTERWEVLDEQGRLIVDNCYSQEHAEFVRQYAIDRHVPPMLGPGFVRKRLDYPKVSEDGNAAMQLMEELSKHPLILRVQLDCMNESWQGSVLLRSGVGYQRVAATGPKALALVVEAVAKELKK